MTAFAGLKVKVLTSLSQMKKMIFSSLVKEVNNRIRHSGGRRNLTTQARNAIRDALYDSPTVKDLMMPNSWLRISLGLTDTSNQRYSSPAARITTIIETIVKNVKFTFPYFSATPNGIAGRVALSGIPWDHEDILNMEEAIQINTEADEGEDDRLEYLRWLLEYGAQIVVTGHYVWTGAGLELTNSRTGYAVMKKGGTGFAIPAEHQGVFGDNFITRAVNEALKTKIEPMMRKLL